MWNVTTSGPRTSPARRDGTFQVTLTSSGGMGVLPYRDGLSVTGYPSGVRGTPVEIVEAMAPLIFWRKDYAPDSGGAGRFRSGLGQGIEIESAIGESFNVHARWERVSCPARGVDGGLDSMPGRVSLSDGTALPGKGLRVVPPGSRIRVQTPGGGGSGDLSLRDAVRAEDPENGLVSAEASQHHYGARGHR